MQKVKLSERRMVEMVEVEGRKNMVPIEIADEFDKKYSITEEWAKEGIRHRVDTREELLAEFIGHWLYADFYSLIMDGLHAWKKYLMTSNMQIGPCFVRKFTIKRGAHESMTRHGWLPEDPKLGLSYAEKDWRDLKEIPGWDFEEETNTKKNPIDNGVCDLHVNWSSDINYPYCFAHADNPYVFHFMWREANEEGYVHPTPVQNAFKPASMGSFRHLLILGHLDPKQPGRHVRFRHRMKLESPNMQPDAWTEAERDAMKEWSVSKSAFQAFMEKEENREYFKEKFGCETLEDLIDKLKKGELREKEVASGIRTYLHDERPGYTRMKRDIYWWNEHYKVDPQTGHILNFGEFEPDNMRARLNEYGFDPEQNEAVIESEEPIDRFKPVQQ